MIGHNARDGNKNRWADGTGRREMEDGREIAVVEARIRSAMRGDERKPFFHSISFYFILSRACICTSSSEFVRSFLLVGSVRP